MPVKWFTLHVHLLDSEEEEDDDEEEDEEEEKVESPSLREKERNSITLEYIFSYKLHWN